MDIRLPQYESHRRPRRTNHRCVITAFRHHWRQSSKKKKIEKESSDERPDFGLLGPDPTCAAGLDSLEALDEEYGSDAIELLSQQTGPKIMIELQRFISSTAKELLPKKKDAPKVQQLGKLLVPALEELEAKLEQEVQEKIRADDRESPLVDTERKNPQRNARHQSPRKPTPNLERSPASSSMNTSGFSAGTPGCMAAGLRSTRR